MSTHADVDQALANQDRKRATRGAAFRTVAAWVEQHEGYRPADLVRLLRVAADKGMTLEQAEKELGT